MAVESRAYVRNGEKRRSASYSRDENRVRPRYWFEYVEYVRYERLVIFRFTSTG